MTRCHVLPGWTGRCDKGTFGCDACEHCTCHRCYAHPAEECTCAEAPVHFGWMSLAPATQDAITAAANCPCHTSPCTCEEAQT